MRIYVCVLVVLSLLVIYLTVVWKPEVVGLALVISENSLLLPLTYTSCYGSAEELRHLAQKDVFQACK